MRNSHLHALGGNVPLIAVQFRPLSQPDFAATGQSQNQKAQCQRRFTVGIALEALKEGRDFCRWQRWLVSNPVLRAAYRFRRG